VVARSLSKHGFSAAALHGELDQSVRMKTLDAFKGGEIQLLVASDVAARGLDIPAVSHVFNLDVPFHADDNIHRIGRTGRAGRAGHAYMLASHHDHKSVDAIEKLIGRPIERHAMEGIEVREDTRPRERKERDGKRGRGGRDRDRRPRPIAPHGQMASMEPAAPAQQATPEPRQEAPKPARREHQPQRQQQAKQPQQQRPQGTKPDHSQLPAFLLRPVKLPKPEPRPETPEDAEA
jgi:superfamily II DNA/RNA helicase